MLLPVITTYEDEAVYVLALEAAAEACALLVLPARMRVHCEAEACVAAPADDVHAAEAEEAFLGLAADNYTLLRRHDCD